MFTRVDTNLDDPTRITFAIQTCGDLELLVRGVASGYLDAVRALADFIPADEMPDAPLLDALTTALLSVMRHEVTMADGVAIRLAAFAHDFEALVARTIYHLNPRPASLSDETYEELVELVEEP